MFLDKLGERIAFERAGTRLYDALIAKYVALIDNDGDPLPATCAPAANPNAAGNGGSARTAETALETSHREFLKQTIARETSMRKDGTEFVSESQEGRSSLAYRDAVNAGGSPSTAISETYSWTPGTELARTDMAA